MIFFNILSCLLLTSFGASEKNKSIVYGFADSVHPAKNQELFFLGFELGFDKVMGKESTSKLVGLKSSTDGSQLGAAKIIKEILVSQPGLIAGFPTSHEALQVAPLSSKERVLTIFPSAGHTKLATFGPYVVTTGESMDVWVNTTIDFLKKKFKNKKGALITNPKAVFSVNQSDTFQKYFEEKKPAGISLARVNLDSNLILDEASIADIRNKKYDYFFVTMYPDESVSFIRQLEALKVDLPILANSSWATGDLEFIRRGIMHKKSPILIGSIWMEGSAESKGFEKLLKTKYNRGPTAEIASGYDVGIIAGTVAKRAGGNYSSANMFKSFYNDVCFDGTSVGKICFPATGGHAIRKMHYFKFNAAGTSDFVRVK